MFVKNFLGFCSVKKILITVVVCYLAQAFIFFIISRTAPNAEQQFQAPNNVQQPSMQSNTQQIFTKVSMPQPSIVEERVWPDDMTVLAVVQIDVDHAELQCNELSKTLSSVLKSTWTKTRIHVLEPNWKVEYWNKCFDKLGTELPTKSGTISVTRKVSEEARVGAVLQEILEQEKPGFFFMLQVGDTIDATYIEKCIWTLFSKSNRAAYISTFWSIGDAKILHSPNANSNTLLEWYGTSPAALFRTDAILAANGLETGYPRDGCNDWEMKWRVHVAGWTAYTIHEDLHAKHEANVHGKGITMMRCTFKGHSDMFGEYLRQTYSLTRANLQVEPVPDNTRNFKRQHILYPWDPKYVAAKPNMAFAPNLQKTRNLLVLIPWLMMGGAETFALNVIKIFTQLKWHVTVLMTSDSTPYGGNVWEPLAKQDTKDVFTLVNIMHKSLFPQFICHIIRSRGIDGVIITNSAVGYLSMAFIKEYCPVGAMLDVNHNWIDIWLDGGYTTFSLDFQEYLDYQVQISKYLAKRMVQEGAKAEKVATIYIGTNTTFFSNQLSQYSSREECLKDFIPELIGGSSAVRKLVVVYLGRLSGEKQPDVFVETMIKLKEQGLANRVAGVVAGAGFLNDRLRQRIEQTGASDIVKLIGSVGMEQKRKLLSCSDVLMMTSLTEGTPLVIFEAMSIGNVIIAPKVGGIPEMVTDKESIIVDNKCSKEEQVNRYANAIKQMLRVDGTSLEKMKRSAVKRARETFDITIMGKTLETLIEKAKEKNSKDGWTRSDLLPKWPLTRTKYSPVLGVSRYVLLHGEWS